MAQLITVRLETCHANSDGVAWYAYYEGQPTDDELEDAFADRSLVEEGNLGWEEGDQEEVPNRLSEHAGLQRYYVAMAC